MYCKNCGKEVNENQDVCLNCGIKIVNKKAKSKLVAGLLAIFLGSLGIHNFYLGYNTKAIIQLLISILSFGFLSMISAIWGVIEGILIFTGSIDRDANGEKLAE